MHPVRTCIWPVQSSSNESYWHCQVSEEAARLSSSAAAIGQRAPVTASHATTDCEAGLADLWWAERADGGGGRGGPGAGWLSRARARGVAGGGIRRRATHGGSPTLRLRTVQARLRLPASPGLREKGPDGRRARLGLGDVDEAPVGAGPGSVGALRRRGCWPPTPGFLMMVALPPRGSDPPLLIMGHPPRSTIAHWLFNPPVRLPMPQARRAKLPSNALRSPRCERRFGACDTRLSTQIADLHTGQRTDVAGVRHRGIANLESQLYRIAPHDGGDAGRRRGR